MRNRVQNCTMLWDATTLFGFLSSHHLGISGYTGYTEFVDDSTSLTL